VSSDGPVLPAVAERLRAEETVSGLLRESARAFAELLDARACTISRVIGDLLVDLVQHNQDPNAARLGHGYLISDYPLTRAVIEGNEPQAVFSQDAESDPGEIALLRELGFDALLMVALEGVDTPWGLVEVYNDRGRRFSDDDVRLARGLAGEVGRLLRRLERKE
jgi:GAF domain-containing protein